MAPLFPCPSCNRHIRRDEAACPFCAAQVDLSGNPEPRLPRTRLGRAATFAFGAAIAAATTAGCSDSHGRGDDAGTEEQDAGPGEVDSGAVAPPYGAPPVDASVAPLYGGAPDD